MQELAENSAGLNEELRALPTPTLPLQRGRVGFLPAPEAEGGARRGRRNVSFGASSW